MSAFSSSFCAGPGEPDGSARSRRWVDGSHWSHSQLMFTVGSRTHASAAFVTTAARAHWEIAAAAGSAWAQLQLGLLQHREHGCEGEARENLLAAAFNGRADGWTEATAHLYLGFLHLDDKLSPCPEAAVMHFRECVRVSRGCPEAGGAMPAEAW